MSPSKRLPFLVTAIIFVIISFGPAFLLLWVGTTFNWSHGLAVASVKVTGWLSMVYAIEVASQIGPKPFQTPLTEFSTYPRSDQIVFVVAGIILLVVVQLPTYFDASLLSGLAFILLGLIISSSIIFIFGTANLREKFFPKALIRWLTEHTSQSTQS